MGWTLSNFIKPRKANYKKLVIQDLKNITQIMELL